MRLPVLAGVAGLSLLAACGLPNAATAATAAAAACSASGADATRHAICADPALLKTDDQMTAAFTSVIALSSAADRQVLGDSQKYWLEDRDTDCDADADGTPNKASELASCIAAEDADRYRFFAGLPDEGPGAAGRIVPVMREGQGFIWSFHFATPSTPAENLVNAKLDGEVAALHIGKMGDTNDYTDIFDAELKYASPDFLSAAVHGEHSPPGGAVDDFAYNLNVDMHTGAALGFADAFSAAALPGLKATCAAQLNDYLTPADGQTAADVAGNKAHMDDAVADLGQWSFGATQATITMDLGDEDPYACKFDYKDLQKLIKPGFPLPH